MAVTVVMHTLAAAAVAVGVRRLQRRGAVGQSFWTDVLLLQAAVAIMAAAHTAEIALWALVFQACGEFEDFSEAFYHSAVNYTTLGYGDIVMSPRWRMLGPFEAGNGVLLFGVSTALMFGILKDLFELHAHKVE